MVIFVSAAVCKLGNEYQKNPENSRFLLKGIFRIIVYVDWQKGKKLVLLSEITAVTLHPG